MKNRIKELRKKRKLTQKELAKRLNVTRQWISSLERQHEIPSLKLANELAMALETSIYNLFDLESNKYQNKNF
ncbi:MAG: helix-turn-helix transcriptional regulator [Peptoniphilaceae bacterium]|nr:helix-turn-helix transcriptional regulator [Peptoniphilaceae bacterium]MDD7383903.1 helix-turn-helix transcriptional regulator [Peptoniphilaceae bacterium]MDY3738044.1 helix-turn-helix transcriptional regulator [Peptoniphilaceae bacterium]